MDQGSNIEVMDLPIEKDIKEEFEDDHSTDKHMYELDHYLNLDKDFCLKYNVKFSITVKYINIKNLIANYLPNVMISQTSIPKDQTSL